MSLKFQITKYEEEISMMKEEMNNDAVKHEEELE